MLNEERVQMFASLLKILANPGVAASLIENGEKVDYVQVVRSIAEIVPYPLTPLIKDLSPVYNPNGYIWPDAGYPRGLYDDWGLVEDVEDVKSDVKSDGGICTNS